MSIVNLFTNGRTERETAQFNVKSFVSNLDQALKNPGHAFKVSEQLASAVSTEGFNNLPMDGAHAASSLYERLHNEAISLGFEQFNVQHNVDRRVADNQIAAAAMALIASENPNKYRKALIACTQAGQSNDPSVIISRGNMVGAAGSIGAFADSGVSLENYDEKSQRDYRVVTAGYNLSSIRQDAFSEALYPTTLINPIEGGAVQILPYIAVVKDVYHSITGQKLASDEMNLVDAFRDPSILEDTSTDLIPCLVDGENDKLFADPAFIAPKDVVDAQGNTFQTSPLKFGAKFDLIGISQKNHLVNAGLLDVSDTLDPAGFLSSIYINVGGKAVSFYVERLPSAVFQPRLIGDTRGASVDFETDILKIDGNTVAVDGSVPAGVSTLKTRNWEVTLGATVNGSTSLSLGTSYYNAGPVEVLAVTDLTTGKQLALNNADVEAMLTQLGDLTPDSYDLKVRFTNTNRRARGHLLQTRALQFRHPIWMHAPITLPMSTMDNEGPGEVAKALTLATDVRNSNNALVSALNYVAQLKEVVGDSVNKPRFGQVEGALSAMMRPTYRYFALDVEKALDGVKSSDRWADVTSLLLNTIKSILFPAYRDSNIESVFQTISGNNDERPKFLIATDREIANYLMEVGDNRTLGAYLKYDVIATNNIKFDGKLLIVPTRENPVENDILSWGQFFYVPTIVADLNIPRGGQISREIAAIPFNRHINNIPFAIEIDVTNLRKVMSESILNGKLGA